MTINVGVIGCGKRFNEFYLDPLIKLQNKNKINRDTTNKEIFLNSFINFKSANNNTNNDYLNFYKKF